MIWIEIVNLIVTFFIAFIAGKSFLFARSQFHVFRNDKPYLNMTHEVSIERINKKYNYVMLNLILHNPSKVQVKVNRIDWSIRRINKEVSSELIDYLKEHFVNGISKIIESDTKSFEQNERMIEPSEIHREVFECIVHKDYNIIRIETNVYNNKKQDDSEASMWQCCSLHNISRGIKNGK